VKYAPGTVHVYNNKGHTWARHFDFDDAMELGFGDGPDARMVVVRAGDRLFPAAYSALLAIYELATEATP
jgi:hypothetical protein